MGGIIGGESTSESEIVQRDRLTPEQMDLLNQLTGILEGEVGQGMDPYPGEMIPGADVLQDKAFAWAERQSAGSTSQQNRESALMDMVMGKPSFERTAESDAEMEQYYQDAFVAPSRAAHEDELAAIAERYAGGNMERSGGFADALGRSTSNYLTGLNAQKAGLIRGDQQDARTSKENALSRVMPAVAASGGEEARVPTLWAQAGAARRGIDRELAGEGVYDWMISQPAYNPWLGYLSLGLNTPAYQFGTESEGNASSGVMGAMYKGAGSVFSSGVFG